MEGGVCGRIGVMEKIIEQIREAVKELYGIDMVVELAGVPEGRDGDYSSNVAMRLAREVGKGAIEVADEIVETLRKNGLASSALSNNSTNGLESQEVEMKFEVAGAGFINISVGARKLFEDLERSWSEDYGRNNDGAGKLALVEFPSPNVAKPYSVGHLRPGTQGWTAKKLLETSGWRVITDNHIGDSGTPFGIWAVGCTSKVQASTPAEAGKLDVYELGRIYIEMKQRLKKEEEDGGHELKDEVQSWVLRLDEGDEEAVRLSRMFNEVSLRHIHEVMGRLGLSTDYEFGERYFVDRGKALVEKYVEKGVFVRNEDGSVICDLSEYGIEVPMLMLKSNGAALYTTTDLACLVQRAEEFAPDLVVHSVGAEQKFYFEQLFALAKKLGEIEGGELGKNMREMERVHLWFGTIDQVVDGKREKMSSRKGVVLMEELLDKAEEEARKITEEREVNEEDVKKIALGAIKFSDFAADRKTGLLFDWDKVFTLSGYSGPFCQYATVRAKRLLELSENFEVVDYADYGWGTEKELLKLLLEYPAVVREATTGLEGHKVANYVFRLAQEFNRYYEAVPVGKAELAEKSARLEVVRKVVGVMESGLDLLGIEVPGKM